MKKEEYAENQYEKLEDELEEVNKNTVNNAFRGALFTSLFALPTIALAGSGLPIMTALTGMSILIPSIYIGKAVRNHNKKKFVDQREEYIEDLEREDQSLADRDFLSEKINELKLHYSLDKIDLKTAKFFSIYSKTVFALLALGTIFIPIDFLVLLTYFILMLSIYSEVELTTTEKKDLESRLQVDNFTNLFDTSLIDYNKKAEEIRNKAKKVVYDVVDDKKHNKTIREMQLDEYLDSLSKIGENDTSKKLIKQR